MAEGGRELSGVTLKALISFIRAPPLGPLLPTDALLLNTVTLGVRIFNK